MSKKDGPVDEPAALVDIPEALAAMAANDVADIREETEEPPSVSERILALFNELHITKVVLVDDRLEKPLDAALVTRIFGDSTDARAAAASFFPDIDLTETNEHLFEQVDAILGKFDGNRRDELAATLAAFDEEAADVNVAGFLGDLMPAEFPIEYLTPAKWELKRDALLDECSPSARTLFLFDQQLGSHGEGTAIIASLAQRDRAAFGARWFCGLLSHTLKVGAEVSTWRALSNEKSIDLELFMPISKQNLSDGDAFYGAVYRTVINIYAERMKGIALDAFKQAFSDTLDKFTNLDPVDFEHMIAKSSEGEGVSELETLFRLYTLIQRNQVKKELLRQDRLTDFLDAARTVKKVADVGRTLSVEAGHRLAKLRANELYEDGDLVNQFRDPLRNGDLFEIGSGDRLKLWVLIAQPCDLMVRSNGKRAYENNFKVAVLAPVKRQPLGELPMIKHGHEFMLDRLDHDGAQAGLVLFTEATPVALNVLDLAALRTDGACEIDTNDDTAFPAFPSISWDKRATKLRADFKRIATKVEATRGSDGEVKAKDLATYLLPPAAPGIVIRRYGAYDKGKFTYEIRRTGRVREPYATSLLAAFSRYLSRDAHEHDFSLAKGDKR